MAHVLTFYYPLRNVLFLNRFVCILMHTRHYRRPQTGGLCKVCLQKKRTLNVKSVFNLFLLKNNYMKMKNNNTRIQWFL